MTKPQGIFFKLFDFFFEHELSRIAYGNALLNVGWAGCMV